MNLLTIIKMVLRILIPSRGDVMDDPSFDRAVNEVLGIEAGYVDHASDRGGKTNWGITQATAKRYGYTGLMHELPLALAKEIYYKGYWAENHVRLELMVAYCGDAVAGEIFEQAVNTGVVGTARRVQRVLNILNRGEDLYDDLKVDGWLGDGTRKAVEILKDKGDLDHLFRWLNIIQGAYYLAVIENDPTQDQEDFARGWAAKRVHMKVQNG